MIAKLKKFFSPLIMISGLCLLVYLVMQQNYRLSANDPQIQITRDFQGEIPKETVEISKSLSVFVAQFDKDGNLVKSNAKLDGNDISIPKGVFDYVRDHGEDKITWQPEKGVRQAIVVNKYKDGFVVSGRSLSEIEKRIDNLSFYVGSAWAGIVIISLFLSIW